MYCPVILAKDLMNIQKENNEILENTNVLVWLLTVILPLYCIGSLVRFLTSSEAQERTESHRNLPGLVLPCTQYGYRRREERCRFSITQPNYRRHHQEKSYQRRIINGRTLKGCTSRISAKKLISGASEHYCPGGGAVIIGYGGSLATCNYLNQCQGDQICNPQFGVCCTRIRTCPRPSITLIDTLTKKPIICQMKFGRVTSCPDGGYCETKTGFCCKHESVTMTLAPSVKTRPRLGQECNVRDGCDGGAVCMCEASNECQCDCPAELGYTISPDGHTCQRIRRRLKEKCKTDMECSAAFSECSTGGCRCKKGFQRDGKGGCKPISYKCINNGQPLFVSKEIVKCSMKATAIKLSRLKLNGTTLKNRKINILAPRDLWYQKNRGPRSLVTDRPSGSRDDCPDEYYCVPLFDDPSKPGYYQGFCCPSPRTTRPVCPVGEPHETSFPPEYGCRDCPIEYYCHRDAYFVDKSMCCPKPCISLEDIYHDGQCYPTAYYGDSCHVNSQCSSTRNSSDEFSVNSPLQCVKGICACPSGFSHTDGECKRVLCTIGLRGEPSVDRNNELIRCDRSADCSQGQMCDPNTHVCCKGINRCPKGYVETGETCEQQDRCKGQNDLCFRSKSGKIKLCCTTEMY